MTVEAIKSVCAGEPLTFNCNVLEICYDVVNSSACLCVTLDMCRLVLKVMPIFSGWCLLAGIREPGSSDFRPVSQMCC